MEKSAKEQEGETYSCSILASGFKGCGTRMLELGGRGAEDSIRLRCTTAQKAQLTEAATKDGQGVVPDDPGAKLPLMIGSDFLQKTGATIRYKGRHPVFCEPPYFGESLGAAFEFDS
jgi:hypothetical protein